MANPSARRARMILAAGAVAVLAGLALWLNIGRGGARTDRAALEAARTIADEAQSQDPAPPPDPTPAPAPARNTPLERR